MYINININTVKGKPAVSVASKEGGLGVNAEKASCIWVSSSILYALSNKNPSAQNFLNPELEATCGTVAIIIEIVSLSPCLRIRGVSLSYIHYGQSHRVYINRRQQYICLI